MSGSRQTAVDAASATGASAGQEWQQLVATAVLGTDRRQVPSPPPGWDGVRGRQDAAIEVLDRAAAVVVARRAGATALAAPPRIPAAPTDPRPECSRAAAGLLSAMLAGHHELLLPEWFACCAAAGVRPAAHLIPALLLRGRRHHRFDAVARAAIGPRAAWVAEAVPELGVRVDPGAVPAGAEAFDVVARAVDSGAVIAVVIDAFACREATWAAVAQLRQMVASIDPSWLMSLLGQLNDTPFFSATERCRVELIGLAQARLAMCEAFRPTPESVSQASGTVTP